ncbi:MAG: hypothetical protein CR967_01265 [Proteobacteria bacterium]|nr:MAG: hypothetical protein CR967_01265 [Pseudomonadota bacterium]
MTQIVSQHKFQELIKCFFDFDTHKSSKITNVSHITCNKMLHKLRIYILKNIQNNKFYKDEFQRNLLFYKTGIPNFEFYKSYFDAKRTKRQR